MNEKQYYSEDQVSLSGLKNLVWAFLQQFFRFIEFTQNTIRRKILYLIAGAIFGIGIALLYFSLKPQVYKADMVLIFNRLTKRTYGEVLQQLNTMLSTGARNRVVEVLQIPQDLAQNTLAINATNMNDRPLVTDTSTRSLQTFKVSVLFARENAAVDTLQNALLHYLNNLPYLKNVSEVEKQNQVDRLKSIESDLAKLDSLKTEYNRFLASSRVPSAVYNNAVNPAEFYEQSTALINLREHARRQLFVEGDAVSVIGPLRLIKMPRTSSLPILMLFFGSIGLFTGFLFGLLLETKRVVLPNQKAR